ncbi:ADP-ribose diphosphatase [Aerococcus urinaehominis]|uniref:ADP-ribose diphosphatase n=1 Tax=Aerococcus urinaehominis TaxID=128944 RepID=A0A0X8FLU3_9LACT|nr:NUDIX hydrolase [Aerococcus urinaehominis]AMB99674.1 ADP-ribose diphosphatase [Aerococcus urinaehominis]SDL89904.1 ADP-ribose pyrophosphatase [Aerococcus urinaehominis]
MEFGEKTLSKQTIYEGAILDLEVHQVALQDGNQAKREIIRHQPAVAILALVDDKIILVKQYRKAIDRAILEVPAGLVDPGEDWLAAAQRELEEETGYQADSWTKLFGGYLSPGYLDEYLQIYHADQLRLVDQPLAQDEDEHIELVRLTLDQALDMVNQGEICDYKSFCAIQYWQLLKAGGHNG